MIFDQMSNLKQRLTVSSLGIPFLVLAIYLSHFPYFRPIFALLVASFIALALFEFYQIAKSKGFAPLQTIGLVCSICYVLVVFMSTQTPQATLLPKVFLLLTLFIVFLYYFIWGQEPFINLPLTIFGLVYLTIPLSLMIKINYMFDSNSVQDGRFWLVYLLAVTKMTDTGGFFIGKKLGKHKLAPYISPKKTWEGAFGGLIFSIITSVIFQQACAYFFSPSPLNITLLESILLGALISVVAQFGDLAESLLKRDVGVKDSGNQVPGLGGILDIADSLIFTVPLMYLFLKIL